MVANKRHGNTLSLASLKNGHSLRDLVLVSVDLDGKKLGVGSCHSKPPSIHTRSKGTNRGGSEKGSSRHGSGKVTKHCSRELSDLILGKVETNCGRNHQFVLQSDREVRKLISYRLLDEHPSRLSYAHQTATPDMPKRVLSYAMV